MDHISCKTAIVARASSSQDKYQVRFKPRIKATAKTAKTTGAGVHFQRNTRLTATRNTVECDARSDDLKLLIDIPKDTPAGAKSWILWDLDNKCPKVRLLTSSPGTVTLSQVR